MSSPAPSDQRLARGEATRARITAAARELLASQGYGAMSTRAVAERADVRLSLVHYHFGGRGGLLVEVLERENERLLERQQELYAAPGPLAEKWRTACAYLDDDLRSGYVRILWELWAAGLEDEELARRWREAMDGWRSLLEDVVERWTRDLGVELAMSPREIAAFVYALFAGVEVARLAGVSEGDAPFSAVLDHIGRVIDGIEQGAGTR